MKKLLMRRKASDNIYYHPDFHSALNIAIDYLEKNHGKSAVKEYLQQFASSYYNPLTESIRKQGLSALKKYLKDLYKKENGDIDIVYSKDAMTVLIKRCPAILHIKKKGGQPAKSFSETTKTVYETILKGTEYEFKMLNYDKKTGRALLTFRKKNDFMH